MPPCLTLTVVAWTSLAPPCVMFTTSAVTVSAPPRSMFVVSVRLVSSICPPAMSDHVSLLCVRPHDDRHRVFEARVFLHCGMNLFAGDASNDGRISFNIIQTQVKELDVAQRSSDAIVRLETEREKTGEKILCLVKLVLRHALLTQFLYFD